MSVVTGQIIDSAANSNVCGKQDYALRTSRTSGGRSKLLFGCLSLILASRLSPCQSQTLALTLDPTTPVEGTSVSFNIGDSGIVSSKAIEGLPIVRVATEDHKYIVMTDEQSFHRDKFRRFSFDCYVEDVSDKSSALIHRFTVWEDPIGKFPDFIGPVSARVVGASGTDATVLRLPEHSDDSENLTVAVPVKAYPVPMGRSSRMELGLSSDLSSLRVSINPVIGVVATKCPDCWGTFQAKVLHDQLGATQRTSLIIDLQPNSLDAFKRNLVVFDSEASQEVLVVTVTSQSDEAGTAVPQDFRIPVRFTPPGGFLMFSILSGALIGCTLRYLISLQAPPPISRGERLITIATAIVAWGVVLALFATKTKATIFGYDLDPTQVVPAGLMTLLAAGGTPFSQRLAKLLGR